MKDRSVISADAWGRGPKVASQGLRQYRRAWAHAPKVLLAVGVMVLMISSGQLDPAMLAKSMADGPVWVLLGGGCLLITTAITSKRWQLLLKAQGLHITFLNALRLSLVGGFFSTFMPGGTGGDIAKAYYVWHGGSRRAVAVVSVLVDRLVGLYAMLGIATCMTLLRAKELWGTPQAKALVVCVPGVFVCATLAIALISRKTRLHFPAAPRSGRTARVSMALVKTTEALAMYRDKKKALAFALALSVTTQLVMAISFYCLGHVLEVSGVDPMLYLLIVPIGMVANFIPVLPMGIGQGETAFHFLYEILASSPSGAEVALLFRGLSMFWAALGGLVYLTLRETVLFESPFRG